MKQKRYYQQECEDAVFRALARGRKKQLIILPGGTGKTFICVNVMQRIEGRKLWISHEETLAQQSAIALLSEMDVMTNEELHLAIGEHESLIDLIRAGDAKKKLSKNARIISNLVGFCKADLFDISKPICIASCQSLWKRLDKIPADHFSVIVADEGDLFGSKTFKEPLDYFTPKLLLGATATGFRSDGMLMEDIFEEIVYEYPIKQAIEDKFLTELNAIVIQTSTNLDDLHTVKGDFNVKELTQKVNTPARNYLIVDKYIEYCSGQRFICFGADVQHVIDLHEAFELKGIKTAYVVSDKEKMIVGTDRKSIVKAYKNGEIFGLINYNIFSAGFDDPDTGTVILGCPTKSKRKFLQQLFRVTRLKTEAFVKLFGQVGTILDVIDGTSKHSLVNTRELDKGLPIEDRLFLSKKNRDLLLEARKERDREFTATLITEDKKVNLLKLPKITFSESFKMSEIATPAQLIQIKRLGYDTENEVYTKKMITDIFGKQAADEKMIKKLKENNYEINGFVSVAEAMAASEEIKKRESLK